MLGTILQSQLKAFHDPNLLVGYDTADDAAVYDLGNGQAIISSTDFFMPIVDDPFDFGRIAATNSLSDIYAMGGKPIMAIAILGFPINKLPAEVAQKIVEGGRSVCHQAGIALAGGHSIDAPEPIFGLAVTGLIDSDKVKKNNSAQAGCELYLTKPLGIGILTTAEKKGKLKAQHQGLATEVMCQLNSIGTALAQIDGVRAMTDVTGFGLAGHLLEICEGANLRAEIDFEQIKILDGTLDYLEQGCVAGGVQRNFDSYGHKISVLNDIQKAILCDPQTSGGLLIAVEPNSVSQVLVLAKQNQVELVRIGQLFSTESSKRAVEIR